MTDIVERLRAHHETPSVIRSHPTICDEAAAEIERLRTDIRGYQQDIFHLQGRVKQNHQLAAEVERLRALSGNNAHSWDAIVRERDELRAEIARRALEPKP